MRTRASASPQFRFEADKVSSECVLPHISQRRERDIGSTDYSIGIAVGTRSPWDSFLLSVSQQETMFKVSWTIVDGDDTASPGAYLIDAGLLEQAAYAVRQQLRVIAFARTPFEKSEFATLLRRLAQRGTELFLQLMDPASDPPEVSRRFEQLAQASSGVARRCKRERYRPRASQSGGGRCGGGSMVTGS
jgi:hypothetical protein